MWASNVQNTTCQLKWTEEFKCVKVHLFPMSNIKFVLKKTKDTTLFKKNNTIFLSLVFCFDSLCSLESSGMIVRTKYNNIFYEFDQVVIIFIYNTRIKVLESCLFGLFEVQII